LVLEFNDPNNYFLVYAGLTWMEEIIEQDMFTYEGMERFPLRKEIFKNQ